ncbi:MAG: alpha/beta fold hydrolase [Myxococcales bacterium]|nr:alpha/beta fold hydrolase [Myxococcales bacterium]
MPSTLPRRALLGAELPADDEAFADGGVTIAGVSAKGMASRAGVRPGDVILSIAGTPIRSLSDLGLALRHAGATSTTTLTLRRGKAIIEAKAAVDPQPAEVIEGATVIYGELTFGRGIEAVRLRTITTRVAQPRAMVLVIQGIACESIDHASSPDAPLAGLVQGWASEGIESMRFDKRGVGDSEGGPCNSTDFVTELADARAALEVAHASARESKVPLFVFGHSVGGIMASLLAGPATYLAGVITYGAPVERWIECLVDSTRRQLTLHQAPPDEIERRTTGVRELARTGELNGRSAAYHAQLDEVDIAAAWQAVTSPVLVLRGEHDWVVRPDDQARIVQLARGATTVVDLLGLDHLFGAHADRAASLRDYGIGAFDDAMVSVTRRWIDRIVGGRRNTVT